jgi:hypothetical protein
MNADFEVPSVIAAEPVVPPVGLVSPPVNFFQAPPAFDFNLSPPVFNAAPIAPAAVVDVVGMAVPAGPPAVFYPDAALVDLIDQGPPRITIHPIGDEILVQGADEIVDAVS